MIRIEMGGDNTAEVFGLSENEMRGKAIEVLAHQRGTRPYAFTLHREAAIQAAVS